MDKYKSKYVCIYNLQQAYFYIQNNVLPVYIDKNIRTGNIYFKFSKQETKDLYNKWLSNKNKK